MSTPQTDSMKDWPMTLKRNAAICELAAALFKARGEYYGGRVTLTDEPPNVRAQFVTHANELLLALAPRDFSPALARRMQVTYGLRTSGCPVISQILPQD